MKPNALHIAFKKAFEAMSNTQLPITQDNMLRLYALYKQASFDITFPNQLGKEHVLVSGFKANALLQVKHLSPDEAKSAYIDLVDELLNK